MDMEQMNHKALPWDIREQQMKDLTDHAIATKWKAMIADLQDVNEFRVTKESVDKFLEVSFLFGVVVVIVVVIVIVIVIVILRICIYAYCICCDLNYSTFFILGCFMFYV